MREVQITLFRIKKSFHKEKSILKSLFTNILAFPCILNIRFLFSLELNSNARQSLPFLLPCVSPHLHPSSALLGPPSPPPPGISSSPLPFSTLSILCLQRFSAALSLSPPLSLLQPFSHSSTFLSFPLAFLPLKHVKSPF